MDQLKHFGIKPKKDKWGYNMIIPQAPSYWKKSAESYDYPTHISTNRCRTCGNLLPENRLIKGQCDTCKQESHKFKMEHGISPPYPETKISAEEGKALMGKGNLRGY